jgi:cyclopropane-fatty-acyl-phospholipid synthase
MIAKAFLHRLFSKVSGGAFVITYWDGSTEHYGEGGPLFRVIFHSAQLLTHLPEDITIWFGEAYMHGQIDVEGDLADVVALAIRNRSLESEWVASGVVQAVGRTVRTLRRSLRRQQEDVVHHYDLGNDFFRLWLDESMTYSCAYFHTPADTLEKAQLQKIDHSLGKLQLAPGETLLDIGSGWGSLLIHAATCYGVKVLGITLSEEQYCATCDSLHTLGLEDRASVRLAHYETLAREGARFDKIVSIGMIEHVGKAHLADFVHALSTLLKPGGLALLHHITTLSEGPTHSWTTKYIFPGGYIPTLDEMIMHLRKQDFHVLDVENLGAHYRLTLDHWSERFERHVETIRKQFGETFVRMWRLYLRGASASFREGSLEVHQILVSRGQPMNYPLKAR